MDLSHLMNKRQLERAKELVLKGLLVYQPFIFSDDLQVGVGHEFVRGEFSGLVYWRTIRPEFRQSEAFKRFLVENGKKAEFAEDNQRLRILYDSIVDQMCSKLGDISCLTFADVGCNSGYFPVSLSKCGAKKAVGFDRENFAECFELLNSILGTRAKFVHRGYDGRRLGIRRSGTYDVAISVAVLCHLSDPLQHLAFLGSMARRAIFVWTCVSNDDTYSIRFGKPNKYYSADSFPFCFDNETMPSEKLLHKSLELMGFTEIHEFTNPDEGLPVHIFNRHKALLGVRPS